jgi:hypothetical protein
MNTRCPNRSASRPPHLEEARRVVGLAKLHDLDLEEERPTDPDHRGEDVDEHDPEVQILVEREHDSSLERLRCRGTIPQVA